MSIPTAAVHCLLLRTGLGRPGAGMAPMNGETGMEITGGKNTGRCAARTLLLLVVVAGMAMACPLALGDASPSADPNANTNADANTAPIVWYGMMPHPYTKMVREGVEAWEKDSNTVVRKVVGEQWTQDDENANIKELAGWPHKAFCLFPADPAGANALLKHLKDSGRLVVCYGAEPYLPTPAPFVVGTDIKAAASVAAERLIGLMGKRGGILNVLQTAHDINSMKRKEAVEKVAAKYPNVRIVQTLSDMVVVSRAKQKLGAALAARGDEIDGIIATGYNATVAAAAVLTEWHKNPAHRRIRFVGIDTAPTVLKAIGDGSIDATICQNCRAHGYITVAILQRMLDGWRPKKEYQFIDTGVVVVTKENLKTYEKELDGMTARILAKVEKEHLTPPAKAKGD